MRSITGWPSNLAENKLWAFSMTNTAGQKSPMI